MVVTTADGNPIRGLTKANFDLRVNRRSQPIEYFDPIDFAAETASPTNGGQRYRRLYLFVFDE